MAALLAGFTGNDAEGSPDSLIGAGPATVSGASGGMATAEPEAGVAPVDCPGH